MTARKRIAVGGIGAESNGFAPGLSHYEDFLGGAEFPPMQRGAGMLEAIRPLNFGLSGFLAAADPADELVGLTWSQGGAGPVVTAPAFERLAGEMLEALAQALPVDALYLDLHGAMVSERFRDSEGELLRRIRALVGPDLPIVASMDCHGNLSEAMLRRADGICAYRTYPHTDREAAGARAAGVLETIFRRGRPPFRTLKRAPFLLPLLCESTLREPSRRLVAQAAKGGGADVAALEYTAGWAPADVAESGPAASACGYDAAQVEAAATRLFAAILAAEADFPEPMHTPAEAVRQALELARTATRPVILADAQDNPGGGGSGDVPVVLAALLEAGAQRAAVALFADPEAVRRAHAAGVGAELTLELGGRHGPPGVAPLRGRFLVRRLGDGRFPAAGTVMAGRMMELGDTALFTIGGVDVLASSRAMQPYDAGAFRHFGVEPADYRILALKSAVHFRQDFEPIAERVLVVKAPGWNCCDLATLPFRHLREETRLGPLGPPFRR
jgi:microcystin degradation protein MlrC